jgi:hypothetical protein
MSTVASAGPKWLTGAEAKAITGMSGYQWICFVKRHGDRITRQKYPGCRMRFLAADVERLAAEAILPATTGA